MLSRLELSPVPFACAAFAFSWAFTALLPLSSFAGRMDGSSLLAKADQVRNPADSYRMKVEVKSGESLTHLEVLMKGTEKVLILSDETHARNLGETDSKGHSLSGNFLLSNRDVYMFNADLKHLTRSSLSATFAGQVATADIARTRWSTDYSARVERSDTNEVQLLLDGTKRNLAYARIRLWLDAKDSRPLRADYLNRYGDKPVKRARFQGYREIAGGIRPTQLQLEDSTGKTSTISILDMEPSEIPDTRFTVASLTSLTARAPANAESADSKD